MPNSASHFAQCPACKYVLPYVDGKVLFGEESWNLDQFASYHGHKLIEPVIIDHAELTRQLNGAEEKGELE